jgi:signal transduction histidine kinase
MKVSMHASCSARILIVDDQAFLMRALCDTLEKEGYETVGLTSGKAALDALRDGSFDLLLTDLMMPEMDGIALLRAALEIDPNLVAVMLSGEGTIATAVEAMKLGALDYMIKPFKLSVMLPVLSRALKVRRLRMEKAQLEQRVRERTAELEGANKELEAFAYSVSHDLSAPLRSVKGFSNILVAEHSTQMSAEAQELCQRIIQSTQRMQQLINDLLRFSHLGRQPLAKEPVNLLALVRESLEDLRKERDERNIEVHVGDLPDCIGDPSLLKQVLLNLLSNALKFTRQKEKAIVEVGAQRPGGEDVYFVRDNGVGFDMKHAKKLFGVFQRLHSDEAFEGTGIGLSIVHRIIQRHGGRVWAEAEVNNGATFYFSLPKSD